MNRIGLLGAAGATGKSIATALRERGIPYRVVGRDGARLQATFGDDPLAQIMTWNPDDPRSVEAVAQDLDAVVNLVGVPYTQFALYPELTRRIVESVVAAGARRFIQIGTVYPYGAPHTPTVAETHPREPHTFKGRMRKEQEQIVLGAHAEGRIEATVLRLPDFYGPEVGTSSLLHGPFKAAVEGGTADMIGPIDTAHEFLFVPDLGPVVVDLIEKPETYGRAWNLAGAGVTTQRKMADQIFAMAGRKPKLRVVGKTVLRVMGLFSPLMRELVEMHYLQTEPVLLDDSALRALLGPVHKTSYAEGIQQTLEAYRKAAGARAKERSPAKPLPV